VIPMTELKTTDKIDGAPDGISDGVSEGGPLEGDSDGSPVVGVADGKIDLDGVSEGKEVGTLDGILEGVSEGTDVGSIEDVGKKDGDRDCEGE
jgi:hypothetical protein